MKIEVIFSNGSSFDALFGGINPDFEGFLALVMGGLVGALKNDCRIEFVLDNGERLELSLIPPVSI